MMVLTSCSKTTGMTWTCAWPGWRWVNMLDSFFGGGEFRHVRSQ
jgi:hypothetical protein